MSYFLHAAPLKDFRLRCLRHKEIFIQTDFSRRMKIIFGHFASQNSADLIDRPSICATYNLTSGQIKRGGATFFPV